MGARHGCGRATVLGPRPPQEQGPVIVKIEEEEEKGKRLPMEIFRQRFRQFGQGIFAGTPLFRLSNARRCRGSAFRSQSIVLFDF